LREHRHKIAGKTGVVSAVPAFSRCSSCIVGCLKRPDGYYAVRLASTSNVQRRLRIRRWSPGPLLLKLTRTAFSQRVQHHGMLCIAAPSKVHFIMPEASGLPSSGHSGPRGDWSGHSTPPSSVGSLFRESYALFGRSTCSERDNRGFPFEAATHYVRGLARVKCQKCSAEVLFTEIHRNSAEYTIRFRDKVRR
jgi:hypothetical protein